MKTFFAFGVVLFCIVGTSVTAATVTVPPPVAGAAKPPDSSTLQVRPDTRTDFSPELVNQVLNISGTGFVQNMYTQTLTEFNDVGALLEFTGADLPSVRFIAKSDDPGTIWVQVDNYVFEEYAGQLLSVTHVPTGTRTTVNPVTYYSLKREIDKVFRRQKHGKSKTPKPSGEIKL